MTSSARAAGPFVGLTVVAVEQAVAAPLCTSRLAAGGARVIKIERHGGDFARNYDAAAQGESSYFVWLNQDKESLELDLKDPDDLALLQRIVARADVFIQNLAPGATERLGLGSAELRATYPRLVTCDISGYGDTGEYRDMKAYDFLVQCETGLVGISGAPGAMGRVGVSVCDIGAGMNALIGITQALFEREKTGRGSGVNVSLFDTLADWMNVPAIHERYGAGAPEPAGMKHPSVAPYGGFTSRDGQVIAISIQNEREWANLCVEVLGDPDLAQDPRFLSNNLRVQHRDDLDGRLAAFFAARPAAELRAALLRARIAFGSVNSVADLWRHPQLRTRPVQLPDGETLEVIDWAVRPSDPPPPRAARVAAAGEHNAELRREFGD
ncbi:MAG: CaiB/BaiF CoA-transferase family protein [Pseudomonadota bacterium]